ncbi:acetate--CoA ligase family protein [Thermosphaera chiliense]|uniref:Acetate--CoA ligase family protein n=1 Tax=Thermosphaera chiliense TaxID=3402707 RepID=A0A7M1URL3_9CREN|nr:acetate--CoA ligase family protein [Thermosphaera aggregans]QOR94157.1 acetate--CoA ligase family protein [Thermosphaera aggregans]
MSTASSLITKVYLEERIKLLEDEVFELLKAYNIPTAPYAVARSIDEVSLMAEKVGFPLVIKIISPDIIHKTDVGGVRLDIWSKQEALKAAEEITEKVRASNPQARINGFLLQPMMPKGVEIIIGGLHDPVFGSVVMFGAGGIFVEVFKDVSFRVAPLTIDEALEMIDEIKTSAILKGYRAQPPVNKYSIAEIIVAVGKMLDEHPEIESMDLNPVFAYPDKAYVIDGRIILRKPGVHHKS